MIVVEHGQQLRHVRGQGHMNTSTISVGQVQVSQGCKSVLIMTQNLGGVRWLEEARNWPDGSHRQ